MAFLAAFAGLEAMKADKQQERAKQRYGLGFRKGQEQKVAQLPEIQRSRLLGTSTLGDQGQSY